MGEKKEPSWTKRGCKNKLPALLANFEKQSNQCKFFFSLWYSKNEFATSLEAVKVAIFFSKETDTFSLLKLFSKGNLYWIRSIKTPLKFFNLTFMPFKKADVVFWWNDVQIPNFSEMEPMWDDVRKFYIFYFNNSLTFNFLES